MQPLIATSNVVFTSFNKHIKGTLKPVKLAGFVILKENITQIDPNHIRDIQLLKPMLVEKKD